MTTTIQPAPTTTSDDSTTEPPPKPIHQVQLVTPDGQPHPLRRIPGWSASPP